MKIVKKFKRNEKCIYMVVKSTGHKTKNMKEKVIKKVQDQEYVFEKLRRNF